MVKRKNRPRVPFLNKSRRRQPSVALPCAGRRDKNGVVVVVLGRDSF